MRSPLAQYLGYLFSPFYRWWWAVMTGVASLLSFLTIPESGLSLSRLAVALLVLTGFTAGFLLLSTITQSWSLYRRQASPPKVLEIHKCKDFNGEYVVLLKCSAAIPSGTLIQLHRRLGSTEVPFAVVKALGTNDLGVIQADPVWIAPGHLLDWSDGKFSTEAIIAVNFVDLDVVTRAIKKAEI
jgi:hypothetical protein